MREEFEIGQFVEREGNTWYASSKSSDLFLHSDGILRISTLHNGEFTGYYPTEEAVEVAIGRYLGIPLKTEFIINDVHGMQYGNYYVCPVGKCNDYLHSDGIIRSLTLNEETEQYTGYFQTSEDAQRAINLHNGETMDEEAEVWSHWYVTFAEEQLNRFRISNKGKIAMRVYAPSEEYVRDLVSTEPFNGNFYAIYDEKAVTILRDELNYSFFGIDYLADKKMPPVPSDHNKELWIDANLAITLCNYDKRLNDVIDTTEYNPVAYIIPSKNAFGSGDGKHIKRSNADILCNKQNLRLGRIIRAIAGHILKDEEIEGIVSQFKTQYEIDTSVVRISDDVASIYTLDQCGGSCMAEEPADWFDIWSDTKSKIAYINDGPDLLARALIHDVVDCETGEEYYVLDRIFYDDEKSKLTLQQWRREQDNMHRFNTIGTDHVRTKHSIRGDYDHVPYVDHLKYAQYINGDYYLATSQEYGSSEDVLQNTDGTSERGVVSNGHGEDDVWCEDDDCYVHIDEAFYCETDGYYYASEYDLVYMTGHGYYREDDDTIAQDEATGDYAFIDDLKYCESEYIYTSSDDYVIVEAGTREGSYEPLDELTYCTDIEGYVVSDEAIYVEDLEENKYYENDYHQHNDGNWYSHEEEEENEDDTEEVA